MKMSRQAMINFALFLLSNAVSISSFYMTARHYDVLSDDAYYYINVASNRIKHGFFTFDGVHPTNGFHPLLAWIETGYFFILGGSCSPLEIYLSVINLLTILYVGTVVIAGWYLFTSNLNPKHSLRGSVLALSVTILSLMHYEIFLSGMESILVIVLCVLFYISIANEKYLYCGIFGMFLTAARLDSFLYLLCPLFFVFLIRKRFPGKGRLFLKLLSPSIGFLLIYSLFQYFAFAHLFPIHGVLKSSFPFFHPQLHLLLATDLIILTGLSFIGLILMRKIVTEDETFKFVALGFGVSAFVWIASFYLFQKWSKPIPPWYLAPVYFCCLITVSSGALQLIAPRYRSFVLSLVFAGTIFYKVMYFPSELSRDFHIPQPETIAFMKTLPKDTIFAATDCGKLSFWSERTIVNLDGLVNNFELQDYLKEHRLSEYLKINKVDYLIVGNWRKKITENYEYEPMYQHRVSEPVFQGSYTNTEFYVFSYLYNTYSDQIILPSGAEVWRSPPYFDEVDARIIIYDLRNRSLS